MYSRDVLKIRLPWKPENLAQLLSQLWPFPNLCKLSSLQFSHLSKEGIGSDPYLEERKIDK